MIDLPFLINTDIAKQGDLFNHENIVHKAKQSLAAPTVHITDASTSLSPGTLNDFYSNGDYWWPNPDTPDGLPYIRRDGESNPGNFMEHRMILRQMRTHVAQLASAYVITGDEEYAAKAVKFLQEFFLDERTRMNPHLLYAQAIPGISEGRGIGIIDTLHLIDVPMSIRALQASAHMTVEVLQGLVQWFSEYLHWMSTHPNGIEEMNEPNNHSICWFVQAAAFAHFTDNMDMLDFCRQRYKHKLLPEQMGLDGSFPLELKRTKPYGYSNFALDNMVILCHICSTPEDNLWKYELSDGRSIAAGLQFLYPYLVDKKSWPYQQDIEHYESWPAGLAFLLFAGLALEKEEYVNLWISLDQDPEDAEVRRNMAIRQPLLWLA
jgi:hypothetical protein